MRGVGALPAARLEQAERPCGVQHAREQALAGVGGEETAAELAEHAVVEAGLAEFEAEQMGWTARDGIGVPWLGSVCILSRPLAPRRLGAVVIAPIRSGRARR